MLRIPYTLVAHGYTLLQNVDDFLGHLVTGEGSLAARAVRDFAPGYCVERVIRAHAHVLAGFDLGAALAHDDSARFRGCAVGKLYAEILCI